MVGLFAAAKHGINQVLGQMGLQLIRAQTLGDLRNHLDAAQRDLDTLRKAASQDQEDEAALQVSLAASAFRMQPVEGEPTETISKAFLHTLLRESAALRKQGDELVKLRRTVETLSGQQGGAAVDLPKSEAPTDGSIYTPIYDYDGLRNDPFIIHNHDFMRDPRFAAAYKRAVQSTIVDHKYYWRVHVALWCANIALSLEGDFVECGVWKGLLSTSIASYFDWNSVNRKFFLFDTFRGVDENLLRDDEVSNISHFRIGYGEDFYDHVVKNFSEFKNIEIIRGSVPGTLATADIGKVSYLSIDMNNAEPEIAAINYFWDKLSPGAPVLLDDYGFVRYEVQKEAMNTFAQEKGVQILSLPTGQGLIIKPGPV